MVLDLIAEWRQLRADPARAERFQRAAFDLVGDELNTLGLREQLATLSDGDREEYLTFLAENLAGVLVSTVGWWVMNELTPVDVWLAGQARR